MTPTLASIAADTAASVKAKANRALREEAARHVQGLDACLEAQLWRDAAKHARLLESALLALDENEAQP
ncbi:MAG: hypothetical protein AB7P35_17890 [Hyphomonadaceae bacterium]